MMAPEQYRLPQMSGSARQLFGDLLKWQLENMQHRLDFDSAKFTNTNTGKQSQHRTSSVGAASGHMSSAKPMSAMPEIEEDNWAEWSKIFQELDTEGNGFITVQNLVSSGLLSQAASEAVARLIDPEDSTGFSKDSYLEAMLKLHGKRRKDFRRGSTQQAAS